MVQSSRRNYLYMVCLTVFFACKSDDHSTLFTQLDEGKTGVNFRNLLQESKEMNVLVYSYFYNGGGVAVGDINNDGLPDLFFSGNMVKNRLYLNRGNFEFEDVTQQSGVAAKQGWCTGASMVDINADGKLDIYICRSADQDPERRKNLLYINNGDLTFTEKAEEYGLADKGYSTQAAFFDYDRDGDLDMLLINHSLQQYSSGKQENVDIRKEKNPDFATKLYRNDNLKFKDVSVEAGINSNVLTFGLGIAVSDINKDGWPDVYTSNDFNEPDYLFINNRDGTFTDKLNECMDHISMFSMGSDFADYNNDALPDLITMDMLPESNAIQKMHSGAENFDKMQMFFRRGFYYQFSRNMLQKNNGDGTFSEVGQFAGVSNTDWSWAALFSDFDNDGNKDLFVSNGYVKDYTDMDFLKYTIDESIKARQEGKEVVLTDFILQMPTNEISNYIFKNDGSGQFVNKTTDWGLNQKTVAAGAAYADLDNDGDMDMIVSNTNEFAGIYRNNSELIEKNNYLKIELKGEEKNPAGLGTKISVYCKDKVFYQEQMPYRGFQSSVDPVLNFGVGKSTNIDSVIVIWPNDKEQKLLNVKSNQKLLLKITEADKVWKYDSVRGGNPLFSSETAFIYHHKENNFSDFTVQTLLPNYLSRQGPCMAKADINKDGLEDVFIGGAKGSAGKIFLQGKDGRLMNKLQPAIAKDSMREDVAAEFFDADGDGDADLYVGSGGYEFPENDPALQDRLYLNDGSRNFYMKENSLPVFLSSTGCVKAGDIDGDGDLDLFVGARLTPGKYPVTPDSRILINDGKGKFTDATAAMGATVKNVGMVTDALWIDLNQDKLNDLVVVGEWMPIKVFINQKGSLKDESASYIKFQSGGWWNKIIAEDFDGDGDKDLVIGNLGLNAQFHASEQQPISMYYKDFDGNGSIDPLFCYFVQGVSYPAASRDDLTDQLPLLKKKFIKYSTYSTATINEMFSKEELQDAKLLEAQILSTVYLENNGIKGFTMRKLPEEIQYSPVYAFATTDANHDGKMDLIAAGNNVWTRIKFSRYDANHGMLFFGDGKGGFAYVPQTESGLNVRGDVRSLQILNRHHRQQVLFGVNDGDLKVYDIRNNQSIKRN